MYNQQNFQANRGNVQGFYGGNQAAQSAGSQYRGMQSGMGQSGYGQAGAFGSGSMGSNSNYGNQSSMMGAGGSSAFANMTGNGYRPSQYETLANRALSSTGQSRGGAGTSSFGSMTSGGAGNSSFGSMASGGAGRSSFGSMASGAAGGSSFGSMMSGADGSSAFANMTGNGYRPSQYETLANSALSQTSGFGQSGQMGQTGFGSSMMR